jgi:hypothetical protein
MLALRQQQLAFLAQHWRHNELVKLQVCVCVCVCVFVCVYGPMLFPLSVCVWLWPSAVATKCMCTSMAQCCCRDKLVEICVCIYWHLDIEANV